MHIGEAFRFSLRALDADRVRTFLTALGMVIGNASVILVVTISLTTQLVRNSQFFVASALGITVLWVPHLASTSQANPTHQRQRMQPARPL